jgi:hypothetical protein
VLTFLGDELFERVDDELLARLILRQEAHGHGIVAGLGQGEARALAQSRSSASGSWIRMPAPSPSNGSAPTAPRWSMFFKSPAPGYDLVAFGAFDMRDKANTARIVLVLRIVEALGPGKPIDYLSCNMETAD